MTAPPPSVAAAFGAAPTAGVRFAGGRGLTWRFGDVVIRPCGELAEARWKAGVLETLETADGCTVPRPIRSTTGAWTVQGWEAAEFIAGEADPTRLDEVVTAGAAFRDALASIGRPGWITAADDQWSRADRIVWADVDPRSRTEAFVPPAGALSDLLGARTVVERPCGLVHGDLLGNVLFASDGPPVIIDWAPYWRPAGTDAAIAVVDAVCWHGLDLAVLADDRGHGHWRDLLVRALAFRVVTLVLLDAWDAVQEARHRPVVDAVLALRA